MCATCESIQDTCHTVLSTLDLLLGGDDDGARDSDESDASTVLKYFGVVRASEAVRFWKISQQVY